MTSLRMQSPLIADRAGERDNNFNLIRMVAATSVLISHAWPLSLGSDAVQPLQTMLRGTPLGALSVYIFFAVSGFFITRSYYTRRNYAAFITARVRRLFPALSVVLLVSVLIAGLFLSTAPATRFWRAAPGYFLSNLTLIFPQHEMPGVFTNNPYPGVINGSLWTLPYELFCYIGVLAGGLAGVIARPKLFAVAAVVFLAFYAAAAWWSLPIRLERIAELGLPFLIGASFWVWRDYIRLSPIILAALILALWLLSATPLFKPGLMLVTAYAVFLIGYTRLPAMSAYNRLGDYSYGMYVWAFPVQQCVAAAGVISPLVNILLAFPLTLICAILSWHFVEGPAMGRRHEPTRQTSRSVTQS